MRGWLPFLCGTRSEDVGNRAGFDRRSLKLRAVPASWANSGGGAVEFPVPASVWIHGASFDGGKRGPAKTLYECAAMGQCD